MKEVLKTYKFHGKETKYKVSNNGDVYSFKNNRKRKLKPTKTGNGYLKVRLSIDGTVYNILIHRMVAETFIPNPHNKPEVNHKDGNKKKNKVTNLEWATRKENADHAYKHNLFGIGEDFSASTISNADCIMICELLSNTTKSLSKIAKEVGCSKKIVGDILYGKTWTYISINYDFSGRKKNSILTEKEVKKICSLLEKGGKSSSEIAEIVGCKVHQVKDIRRYRSWRSISKNYKF